MPFEVQADGPYFNLLDFFGRLSRLSRIINVGDLEFDDPDEVRRQRSTHCVRERRYPEYLQQQHFSPSPLTQDDSAAGAKPQRSELENPERE